MNCKNCGRPVVPVNWTNGPGWAHKRAGEPHTTGICLQSIGTRHTFAEPETPVLVTSEALMFAERSIPEPVERPPAQYDGDPDGWTELRPFERTLSDGDGDLG